MSSVEPWDDAVALLKAGSLGVPIEWPNAPFTKPSPPAPYISVEMTADSDGPIEIARNAAWIERGRLYIEVHAPLNTGTRPSRVLAQSILALFRDLGPRNVVWESGTVGMGQRNATDGAWWTLYMSVSYKWESRIS